MGALYWKRYRAFTLYFLTLNNFFMAKGTPTYVTIAGAESATLQTALSNGNTAIATLIANANNAIYDPSFQPQILNSGLNTFLDDTPAVAYQAWWTVFYPSAS